MSGGGYLSTQRVLGGLLFLVGAALVVSALAHGGGPIALGVILGAMFMVLGAARIKLAKAAAPRGDR